MVLTWKLAGFAYETVGEAPIGIAKVSVSTTVVLLADAAVTVSLFPRTETVKLSIGIEYVFKVSLKVSVT